MPKYPEVCPGCKEKLRGGPIPDDLKKLYEGDHFYKIIGISKGGVVVDWQCPKCYHRWPVEGAA